jgi:ornithine--oxo-acid transaminase
MNEFMQLERRYGVHNYHPLPVVLSRGRGVWVWDCKGKKYLDMLSAYSALSHGHLHPKLVQAAQKQMRRLTLTSRAFYNDRQGLALKEIAKITGMDRVLLMNSGAEAVESAIKAARKWGYEKKKIPHGRAEILVAEQNFHGRTTTIISFSSDAKSRDGFGPLTPGFKRVPFGSIEAFRRALSPRTCAFLVEPMQGEAGIILPPRGWLTAVSEICREHNVLLILDEIQTGLGRTGKMFACQHENVKPDGLILGKALGGGLMPVSAFAARRDILDLLTPGTHGSTFGGNPLAAVIALEAIRVVKKEKLAENSARLGAYLLSQIQEIRSPLITAVRGQGLWVGVDIDPKQRTARSVAEELMEEGILVKDTRLITLRFAPPLIITRQEIDWAVQKIKKVLHAR